MINDISKWAGSIVIAVIVVTILEMLLPEGKNKKYIKTVMGIYILFTIISPIVKTVSGKDIDIESLIEVPNSTVETNNISMQTNASIENIYISNLKKDISSKLKQKGYLTENLDLSIETQDEETYGKIYEMSLSIKKDAEAKQNNTWAKIQTIEISIGDTGLKKKLSDENSITESEKLELKNYLSSTYDVETRNIVIKEAVEDDSR